MTMDPLPDRWTTRDLPVLMELARRLDRDPRPVQTEEVQIEGLSHEDINQAGRALLNSYPPYVDGQAIEVWGGPGEWLIKGLTERGRRAAGLWPSGEQVDALVDALKQAEQTTSDPEERSLIRRAIGAVSAVSRDIMVDVTAAVIAKQVNGA